MHYPSIIHAIPFELNLKKRKWLFISIYKSPSQNSQYFFDYISDMIYYSNRYEYKEMFGDFNMKPVKPGMKQGES